MGRRGGGGPGGPGRGSAACGQGRDHVRGGGRRPGCRGGPGGARRVGLHGGARGPAAAGEGPRRERGRVLARAHAGAAAAARGRRGGGHPGLLPFLPLQLSAQHRHSRHGGLGHAGASHCGRRDGGQGRRRVRRCELGPEGRPGAPGVHPRRLGRRFALRRRCQDLFPAGRRRLRARGARGDPLAAVPRLFPARCFLGQRSQEHQLHGPHPAPDGHLAFVLP